MNSNKDVAFLTPCGVHFQLHTQWTYFRWYTTSHTEVETQLAWVRQLDRKDWDMSIKSISPQQRYYFATESFLTFVVWKGALCYDNVPSVSLFVAIWQNHRRKKWISECMNQYEMSSKSFFSGISLINSPGPKWRRLGVDFTSFMLNEDNYKFRHFFKKSHYHYMVSHWWLFSPGLDVAIRRTDSCNLNLWTSSSTHVCVNGGKRVNQAHGVFKLS